MTREAFGRVCRGWQNQHQSRSFTTGKLALAKWIKTTTVLVFTSHSTLLITGLGHITQKQRSAGSTCYSRQETMQIVYTQHMLLSALLFTAYLHFQYKVTLVNILCLPFWQPAFWNVLLTLLPHHWKYTTLLGVRNVCFHVAGGGFSHCLVHHFRRHESAVITILNGVKCLQRRGGSGSVSRDGLPER